MTALDKIRLYTMGWLLGNTPALNYCVKCWARNFIMHLLFIKSQPTCSRVDDNQSRPVFLLYGSSSSTLFLALCTPCSEVVILHLRWGSLTTPLTETTYLPIVTLLNSYLHTKRHELTACVGFYGILQDFMRFYEMLCSRSSPTPEDSLCTVIQGYFSVVPRQWRG